MTDFILVPLETTGVKIASENIAGTNFQLQKLTIGDPGVDDGPVSLANPLPVSMIGDREGEDHTDHLTGVGIKLVKSTIYSGTPFFAASDVDYLPSFGGAPSILLSAWALNFGTTMLYLQVHNKATVPTAGNVPSFVKPLPAGTATAPGIAQMDTRDFGVNGLNLTTGCSIGISSTLATFTAHGTAAETALGGVGK